eukprot:SM000124S25959  [mRNA]  locus=s124:399251:399814:+ [translate_table: standard]
MACGDVYVGPTYVQPSADLHLHLLAGIVGEGTVVTPQNLRIQRAFEHLGQQPGWVAQPDELHVLRGEPLDEVVHRNV